MKVFGGTKFHQGKIWLWGGESTTYLVKTFLFVMLLATLPQTAYCGKFPPFLVSSSENYGYVLSVMWFDSKVARLDGKRKARAESRFEKVCAALANSFSPEGGPFGFGIFTSTNCLLNPDKNEIQNKGGDWTLSIQDDRESLKIEIASTEKRAAKPLNFSIPYHKNNPEFLALKEFTDLLACAFMHDTGFFGLTSPEMFRESKRPYLPFKRYIYRFNRLPEAPKSVDIFDPESAVVLETKRQIGVAKVVRLSHKERLQYRAGDDELPIQLGWSLRLSRGNSLPSESLLLGRKPDVKMRKVMANIIRRTHYDLTLIADSSDSPFSEDTLSGFTDGIFNSLLAARLGLRYGLPITQNTILLANTRLVNILFESRGGFLKGFRVQSDSVPLAKDSFRGKNYFMAWSRLLAGWSFGFDPGYIVRNIDIIPRAGIWTFKANFPVVGKDEELEQRKFSFSRKLSLGYEIGLEIDTPVVDTRIMHGRDVATSVFGQEADRAGANSQRYGLDFTIDGPQISVGEFDFDFIVLGYFMIDKMLVTGADAGFSSGLGSSGVGNTDKSDEVFYDVIYFGAGVGLSW